MVLVFFCENAKAPCFDALIEKNSFTCAKKHKHHPYIQNDPVEHNDYNSLRTMSIVHTLHLASPKTATSDIKTMKQKKLVQS